MYEYYKDMIAAEDKDAAHITHDLKIVITAMSKPGDDMDWDELRGKCHTAAGRDLVHTFEMRNTRSEEYRLRCY